MDQTRENGGVAQSDEKVRIFAKNVGNAPILKSNEFNANASSQFSRVTQHIQSKIRNASGHENATVQLFINQSFCPSPEEQLGDLFKCFQTDGKLVVHYALMEAWG
mmetsp:Transcript_48217/g.127664  ORF Transcript_48217/g.127664 Transcript_48217/m.127664 type:complete len:106 (-) Transcript_48217:40-357(-)